MPKQVSLSLLAALALGLAGPGAARAQRLSSPYQFVEAKQDLGITIGYILAGAGSAGIGPRAGPAIAVRYTRRVSRPLSLSPQIALFRSEREVIDPSLEGGAGDGDGSLAVGREDIDLLLISGRINLNLTGARTFYSLTPYVFGGIGIAMALTGSTPCPEGSTRPDCQIAARERLDFGTSFLMELGIGTVWLPGRRIGVRFELVDHIWRLSTPPGYYDPGVTIRPIPAPSDWTGNLELGLSLTYWF